jgi:hypothetical protein
MDTRDLDEKGLKLRREMFGDEAVDKRMKAFGAFGEPLQHIINAYAYGDVWSRPALPLATESLAMVAMMAGAGRTNELCASTSKARSPTAAAPSRSRTSSFWSPCIAGSPRPTKPIASRSMCCVRPKASDWRERCCASATWVRSPNFAAGRAPRLRVHSSVRPLLITTDKQWTSRTKAHLARVWRDARRQ